MQLSKLPNSLIGIHLSGVEVRHLLNLLPARKECNKAQTQGIMNKENAIAR